MFTKTGFFSSLSPGGATHRSKLYALGCLSIWTAVPMGLGNGCGGCVCYL